MRLFTRKPQTWAEINAASIAAIPADQLPDAGARLELMRRALAGQEVRAYQTRGSTQWLLWVYSGPWDECRHHPTEWTIQWHQEGEPRP